MENKLKIVFFVKQGIDNFLADIITGLSVEYETKKIIVTEYRQIDEGMKWADICWFEWCDELVIYGSKLLASKKKKIICRLHRYEALTDYPKQVNWENVDKLIIVTRHLEKLLDDQIPDINKKVDIVTINNGVNLDKYEFKERERGFNIAYVGYIHSRKNPVLLLQIMNELIKKDNRYKLYIAGQFQERLIELYWNDQINKMRLKDNIIFQGWQSDIGSWLEDKEYILSTSIHESFGYGIAEAMARGIKPVIHNFLFADEIWDKKYMFNSIDEAVKMISENDYKSKEYRSYIESKYSLNNQLIKVNDLINSLFEKKADESLSLEYLICFFNIFTPYSSEYIDKFVFQDCYISMGKKEIISQNIYLIEFIVNNKFGKQLVLTNILYDINKCKVILPDYILTSKNCNEVLQLMSLNLNLNTKLSKDIEGYIFDKGISNDIEENQLAYLWERGIPATQFMPALGWLKIIERYKFALNFINSSHTILEAASGFGYGAAYLHDKCQHIYALDLAQENIEFAKRSYDFDYISWIKGDVTKLPFKDNRFDVYTSFETLEHLPLDLVEAYFNEAVRVLKDDGIMIISTPNAEERKNINNPFHIKEYDYNGFDKMLHKHFSSIRYYSVVDYKVEDGMKSNAVNMIAVCSNGGIKINSDNLSKDYNEINLLKARFMINSDDINNSEKLFDYLLDNNMEREYMKYISEWFIRSSYDYTNRFNYYYSNMYRKFNSYCRFKYIDDGAYKEMELVGNEFCNMYFNGYFKNQDKNMDSKNMLFILNGLDIKQSIMQFFINYLSKIDKSEFNYSVLSLLNKNEFNNSEESINCFNKLNINLLVPESNDIEGKIKEFYEFISENNINYCVYSTLYYAPIGVLLYPVLCKMCKTIGLIQFQQPEMYFDKKVDFVYTYIKKDNLCKNIFDIMSPINTDKVDKNFNIRDLFDIDANKKIIVSMGRNIKYKNMSFWEFVKKIVSEIDDVCFVVFGCAYNDFIEYVPEIFIKEKKIFFAGFNLDASAYLRSCDFYLNSYNISGGYCIEEAYYAGLPIITFYENEENGKVYDSMTAGYYTTAYLYKDSDKVFPKVGHFDDLFLFTKQLVGNSDYREYVQGNRIVCSNNLTFSNFVNEFEKYIANINK